VHQEIYKGRVSELISHFEDDKTVGEITVVMSGICEQKED
jgi:16S rRNA C1402 (ribose-2'-O) methylase RsmI